MKDNQIKKLGNEYNHLVGDGNGNNATIKNIVRDYSDKFDTLQVCFISDLHIGSSDFNINELLKSLEYANKTENAVVFFLGDALNAAIIGSKSDAYEDILNPQQELDIYGKILKIANGNTKLAHIIEDLNNSGKIVVVHSGNHEDRITRAVGISPTKAAAEIAGVGESYAPYYANTQLILRQPLADDGKFTINIATHHGTGIRNVDGAFRLLRTISNADMCVIGHTHQHQIKTERIIKNNSNGGQYYQDVTYLVLPASGGGTYGAGMALPDVFKQTAVWVNITSQPNPYFGKLSPTGVGYRKFVPAYEFYDPCKTLNTNIKTKRVNDAEKAINNINNEDVVFNNADIFLESINKHEQMVTEAIKKVISERNKKVPKKDTPAFEEYINQKQNQNNTPSTTQPTDIADTLVSGDEDDLVK